MALDSRGWLCVVVVWCLWIATPTSRLAMTAGFASNKILSIAVGLGLFFKDFRVELD